MADRTDAPLVVTLLGTGSPLPDPHRAGPATLVCGGGEQHLVDAGRGVVMRLAAAGSGPTLLTSVLLTHLHSDHVTDLGDLVTTRWVTGFDGPPLRIVGPVGTAAHVGHVLASLEADIGYRLAHHDDLGGPPRVEVHEVGAGPLPLDTVVRITAGDTDHRPVHPSLAYRFDHEGASVVTAGDTVPCSTLDDLARGAGALVHTVLRKDVIGAIDLARLQDTMDYHSSPEEAAGTAARAGVGLLAFTHYVPAPPPGGAAEWVALAAEHFAGRIEAGDDLHRIDVHPS